MEFPVECGPVRNFDADGHPSASATTSNGVYRVPRDVVSGGVFLVRCNVSDCGRLVRCDDRGGGRRVRCDGRVGGRRVRCDVSRGGFLVRCDGSGNPLPRAEVRRCVCGTAPLPRFPRGEVGRLSLIHI